MGQAAAQGHREGEVSGQLKSLFIILAARGLVPTEAERTRIAESAARIDELLASAATCASIRDLLLS